MNRFNRKISILICILGFATIIIGGIFIFEGVNKNNLIMERMKVEKVTIALDPDNPNVLTQITNGEDAQKAADIIASHRRAIAPSYQDLLDGGKFDPANPKHLTYSQAMNLENYLYLGVTAFGLIQVVMGAGAFMIIAGIALFLGGLILYRISGQYSV